MQQITDWLQTLGMSGRVVLISGEPGIGKSRLTAALSEAIERPPQQNDASCLHEECAQVTVAPLGDAPKDGFVSGRHLLELMEHPLGARACSTTAKR